MHSIRDLFKDHRATASAFQLERFVLALSAAGTWWGYYKQALREAHSRLRSLQLGAIELERSKRALERVSGRDADLEEAKLRIEIDDTAHVLEETREHLAILLAHAAYAREKLGEAALDDARRETLEREFWQKELCRTALCEALSMKPTSPDVWKTLSVLPNSMRERVREAIMHPENESMSDFTLEVPELAPLSLPSVQALVKELGC